MTEERLEYLTQKREMVLEKLKPLCEYFGIKYDYEISDGKQTETLVLKSLWRKIKFEWKLRKAIRLGKKVRRLKGSVTDDGSIISDFRNHSGHNPGLCIRQDK